MEIISLWNKKLMKIILMNSLVNSKIILLTLLICISFRDFVYVAIEQFSETKMQFTNRFIIPTKKETMINEAEGKEKTSIENNKSPITSSNSDKIRVKCKFYQKLLISQLSLELYLNCMMNVYCWHRMKETLQTLKKVIGTIFCNI